MKNSSILYRKRPLVIEAVQFDGSLSSLEPFFHENATPPQQIQSFELVPEGIYISTLEGKMLASPGDYIIRGIHQEYYPCKADIFEKTYEKYDTN